MAARRRLSSEPSDGTSAFASFLPETLSKQTRMTSPDSEQRRADKLPSRGEASLAPELDKLRRSAERGEASLAPELDKLLDSRLGESELAVEPSKLLLGEASSAPELNKDLLGSGPFL